MHAHVYNYFIFCALRLGSLDGRVGVVAGVGDCCHPTPGPLHTRCAAVGGGGALFAGLHHYTPAPRLASVARTPPPRRPAHIYTPGSPATASGGGAGHRLLAYLAYACMVPLLL